MVQQLGRDDDAPAVSAVASSVLAPAALLMMSRHWYANERRGGRASGVVRMLLLEG